VTLSILAPMRVKRWLTIRYFANFAISLTHYSLSLIRIILT